MDDRHAQAIPEEFRRDVVAVARKREGSLLRSRRTSGFEYSCQLNWLRTSDVEDGKRPGVTKDESDELRRHASRSDCSSRRRR